MKDTDIEKELTTVSKQFFEGMPNEYIEKSIQTIIGNVKARISNDKNYKFNEGNEIPITIYYRELQEIESLNNEKLERLAFAFLVYYKWCGLEYAFKNKASNINQNVFIEKNSDVFKLAHITNENTSGNRKSEMLHMLVTKGLYRFYSKPSSDYMFTHKQIVTNLFYVPIAHEYMENQIKYYQEQQSQANTEEDPLKLKKLKEISQKLDQLAQRINSDKVAFKITSFDDIILYYRHYKNDPNIINCSLCSCPIEKTNNRKKYCNDCAAEKKREQNQRYSQMAG